MDPVDQSMLRTEAMIVVAIFLFAAVIVNLWACVR